MAPAGLRWFAVARARWVGGVPGWRRAGRTLANLRPTGPSASKTPATTGIAGIAITNSPNPRRTQWKCHANESSSRFEIRRVARVVDDRHRVPRQPVSDLRVRYLVVRAVHRVDDLVRAVGVGLDDLTLDAHPMRSQVAVVDI